MIVINREKYDPARRICVLMDVSEAERLLVERAVRDHAPGGRHRS